MIVRLIRPRPLATCDSGSALAEIAIVLPLLVLLLIGLMEVGRYGNYTIVAGNAARSGVQYGAQNLETAADITGMQTRALSDGQNLSGLTATASNYCECADGSTSTCLATDCPTSHRIVYVQVLTSATIPSLTNFAYLPAALRTVTVRGQAVMRVAQ
jgi:Flp pilus assembly protein TadG